MLTGDEELDDPVEGVDVDCTEEDWLVVMVVTLEDLVEDGVDFGGREDEDRLVVTVVELADPVVDLEVVCEEDGLFVTVETELDGSVETGVDFDWEEEELSSAVEEDVVCVGCGEDVVCVDCEEDVGVLVTVEEELGCEEDGGPVSDVVV